MGGGGVWFQSRGRGREPSPQVGDGRKVERGFSKVGRWVVMGGEGPGTGLGRLVPTSGEGLLISSQIGAGGGGGRCEGCAA